MCFEKWAPKSLPLLVPFRRGAWFYPRWRLWQLTTAYPCTKFIDWKSALAWWIDCMEPWAVSQQTAHAVPGTSWNESGCRHIPNNRRHGGIEVARPLRWMERVQVLALIDWSASSERYSSPQSFTGLWHETIFLFELGLDGSLMMWGIPIFANHFLMPFWPIIPCLSSMSPWPWCSFPITDNWFCKRIVTLRLCINVWSRCREILGRWDGKRLLGREEAILVTMRMMTTTMEKETRNVSIISPPRPIWHCVLCCGTFYRLFAKQAYKIWATNSHHHRRRNGTKSTLPRLDWQGIGLHGPVSSPDGIMKEIPI